MRVTISSGRTGGLGLATDRHGAAGKTVGVAGPSDGGSTLGSRHFNCWRGDGFMSRGVAYC